MLTLHTCLKLKLGRCASLGFFSRCSKFELSSSFSRQQSGSILISTGNLANKVKVRSGVDGRNGLVIYESSCCVHGGRRRVYRAPDENIRSFEALICNLLFSACQLILGNQVPGRLPGFRRSVRRSACSHCCTDPH